MESRSFARFDAIDCDPAGAAPGSLRLRGRDADGRCLLLDLYGAAALPPGTSRLTDVVVAGVDVANGATWSLQSRQGRFELGAARLFVHEDVTALATAAVPPRAVPLSKRLFWRLVFALLGTRAGRRWLEQRAARN